MNIDELSSRFVLKFPIISINRTIMQNLGLKTRYIDLYNSSDCPTMEAAYHLDGLEQALKEASKSSPIGLI